MESITLRPECPICRSFKYLEAANRVQPPWLTAQVGATLVWAATLQYQLSSLGLRMAAGI